MYRLNLSCRTSCAHTEFQSGVILFCCIYTQKGPISRQKRPERHRSWHRYKSLLSYETNIGLFKNDSRSLCHTYRHNNCRHLARTFFYTKEPCISAKETYSSAKDLVVKGVGAMDADSEGVVVVALTCEP